jgi:hypothetical protein
VIVREARKGSFGIGPTASRTLRYNIVMAVDDKRVGVMYEHLHGATEACNNQAMPSVLANARAECRESFERTIFAWAVSTNTIQL